jgi:hypothetical protein
MNGFHIVRTRDAGQMSPAHPGVYHFLVKDPKGQEQDVVVQIDASAVAMVERMIHRPLPIASSFWTSYAEHILAAYVWDKGRIPSMPLIITQVERRDVDLAARWEETM